MVGMPWLSTTALNSQTPHTCYPIQPKRGWFRPTCHAGAGVRALLGPAFRYTAWDSWVGQDHAQKPGRNWQSHKSAPSWREMLISLSWLFVCLLACLIACLLACLFACLFVCWVGGWVWLLLLLSLSLSLWLLLLLLLFRNTKKHVAEKRRRG